MSPPNFHPALPAPDPPWSTDTFTGCFTQLLTGFVAGFLGNSVTFESWNVGHIASAAALKALPARAPQIISFGTFQDPEIMSRCQVAIGQLLVEFPKISCRRRHFLDLYRRPIVHDLPCNATARLLSTDGSHAAAEKQAVRLVKTQD